MNAAQKEQDELGRWVGSMQAAAELMQSFRNPRYEPKWYPSPISLPEKRSGKLFVQHSLAQGRLPVVGARQAFARGGMRPVSAVLPPEGLRIHQLMEDDVGMWMSDSPEELNQIEEVLHTVNPQGRVLIGGLGLGILAKRCTMWEGVKHVVVVERSSDVINLCRDHNAYETWHSDIMEAILHTKERFDCFLLDTWQGTNEATYWDHVLPLRRAVRNRFGLRPKIWCWAEDIMWGQVGVALMQRTGHWFYKKLPTMKMEQVRWFLTNVGSKAWEKRYGHMIVSEKEL